jgi:oligo-1,6-glucosidase
MKRIRFTCRDNSRTPFQWNSTANGGFTTGTPWIKVNPNYNTVNEDMENKDSNSILNYFRKLVQLRKDNLTLVYGKYTLLDKNNPDVYIYTREMNGEIFLVLLNFKSIPATFHTGLNISQAKLLLDNYINPSKGSTLKPYEAAVYLLR